MGQPLNRLSMDTGLLNQNLLYAYATVAQDRANDVDALNGSSRSLTTDGEVSYVQYLSIADNSVLDMRTCHNEFNP